MINKDKEDIFMQVLEHLQNHDVQKAVEVIDSVQDPRTATWIGMGVFYVVGTDSEYADTFEEFRSIVEK